MPEITKQDALRWLEMQRDAINTEIAYAAPSDKNQYFRNLWIVNWIADRVKDMTAVEYLEARREMCDDYRFVLRCNGKCFDRCVGDERKKPREAVAIVKRWKEERDGKAHAEG